MPVNDVDNAGTPEYRLEGIEWEGEVTLDGPYIRVFAEI